MLFLNSFFTLFVVKRFKFRNVTGSVQPGGSQTTGSLLGILGLQPGDEQEAAPGWVPTRLTHPGQHHRRGGASARFPAATTRSLNSTRTRQGSRDRRRPPQGGGGEQQAVRAKV